MGNVPVEKNSCWKELALNCYSVSFLSTGLPKAVPPHRIWNAFSVEVLHLLDSIFDVKSGVCRNKILGALVTLGKKIFVDPLLVLPFKLCVSKACTWQQWLPPLIQSFSELHFGGVQTGFAMSNTKCGDPSAVQPNGFLQLAAISPQLTPASSSFQHIIKGNDLSDGMGDQWRDTNEGMNLHRKKLKNIGNYKHTCLGVGGLLLSSLRV